MPVSVEINTKKEKSQSELLCDQMDAMIAESRKHLANFAKIKEDVGYEKGLLKKALSLKLGRKEDLRQIVDEMKEWKAEVKNEVKGAVMEKKRELKEKRKTRRQNLRSLATAPEPVKTTRKKKSRGGFI